MYILGLCISLDHHPAACLLKDGEILAAAEEERFNRVKYSVGHPFPKRAIDFV
jgi:carbamoyltransferase